MLYFWFILSYHLYGFIGVFFFLGGGGIYFVLTWHLLTFYWKTPCRQYKTKFRPPKKEKKRRNILTEESGLQQSVKSNTLLPLLSYTRQYSNIQSSEQHRIDSENVRPEETFHNFYKGILDKRFVITLHAKDQERIQQASTSPPHVWYTAWKHDILLISKMRFQRFQRNIYIQNSAWSLSLRTWDTRRGTPWKVCQPIAIDTLSHNACPWTGGVNQSAQRKPQK